MVAALPLSMLGLLILKAVFSDAPPCKANDLERCDGIDLRVGDPAIVLVLVAWLVLGLVVAQRYRR